MKRPNRAEEVTILAALQIDFAPALRDIELEVYVVRWIGCMLEHKAILILQILRSLGAWGEKYPLDSLLPPLPDSLTPRLP